MNYGKFELFHLYEMHGRCSIHFMRYINQLTCSVSRGWTSASSCHSDREHQVSLTCYSNSKTPECQTGQGKTQCMNYHSANRVYLERMLQHMNRYRINRVGKLRLGTNVSSCGIRHIDHYSTERAGHLKLGTNLSCVDVTNIDRYRNENLGHLRSGTNINISVAAHTGWYSTECLGHGRSVISVSSSVIKPAAKCAQHPESVHHLKYHCVLRSKNCLGIVPSCVPQSAALLSLFTNSCVSFHSVRWYRGQTRSSVLQNNSNSQNIEAGTHLDVGGTKDADSDDPDMSSSLPSVSHDGSLTELDADLHTKAQGDISVKPEERNKMVPRKPVDEMTLWELSRVSLNIVPYVKRCVTLQNLVMLGVNLDRVQKVAGVAEHLVKADFNGQIVPLLKFLTVVGINIPDIGHVLTTNPLLFKESVEDLELRVGYLVHKNFGLREVASMVIKDPVFLLMDPIMMDEKLAFIQNLFHFTAHEVREVVKLCPRLLPYKKKLLADMKFHLKEFVGFTDRELQQLVLKSPWVLFSNKDKLVTRFDYLHNYMLISHQHLLTWPDILKKNLYVVKTRHLFLQHKDRAQYDPCQENYVSLKALATNSDKDFCQKVAKCELQEFYDFCKTL